MNISEIKLVDPTRNKKKFSRVVYEFNETDKVFPKDKSIHALFSKIARSHKDKTAIISKGETISYGELEAQSNQMAAFLIDKGVVKENVVAVLMETSIQQVVSILGILKAGGCYVGINEEYPLERIKFILNDTKTNLIVSQKKFITDVNKLQWECEALKTYLLVDSDDVYSEGETENELMRADLWNFIGEDAKNDIEGGGWISSYTGKPLAREVMEDYGNNILKKLKPFLNEQTSVLEIGCASGISMFKILPFVKDYFGTDISESILAKTKKELGLRAYRNVTLKCLSAHEIKKIKSRKFDVIVLNSVIQCFNGLNYLNKVIEQAIRLLKPKGLIFIGDIMEPASKSELMESLLNFKKKNRKKGYITKTDWSNELFVAREFFDDLRLKRPFIASVTHSDKITNKESELSKFRYDTILSIDKHVSKKPETPNVLNKYQFGKADLFKYKTQRITETVTSSNLAYVTYTSGSSGNPKGVLIEHKGIIRLVRNTNYIQFKADDVVLQANAISFDASAFEIWGALLNGSILNLISKEEVLDEDLFPDFLHNSGVTIALFIPSLFNHYVQKNAWMFKNLRILFLGGEAISPEHVHILQKLKTNVQIINAYGPTENSVISTTFCIRSEQQVIPIGKPISNSQCYILDENNNPLPEGIEGELWVSGEGLARAYLNDPQLTQMKFIDHPFKKGEKMYKTGDFAKWLKTGDIQFLGRKDDQVKIRGFRIELSEIEKCLTKIPEVKESTLIASTNDQELIAFVIIEENASIKKIREALSLELPEYMVPSKIMAIDRMPLGANGKIDKDTLLELKAAQEMGYGDFDVPNDSFESRLLNIWIELLGIKAIGTKNNFFSIGGHSLKATQMVSRIRKEFNAEMSIRDVFTFPTISELAVLIRQKAQQLQKPIPTIPIQKYYDVSHAQQRLWVLDQLEKDKTIYLMPSVFSIKGKLEKDILDQAFKMLISRHESLRTTIPTVDYLPKQKIHKFEPNAYDIEFRDLHPYRISAEQEREEIREETTRTFILDRGPLIRATLLQLEKNNFLFILTLHHIICDGWSLNILINELFGLYKTLLSNDSIHLKPLKVNYKEFVQWQNQQLKGALMSEHKSYWFRKFTGEIPVLEMPTDYPRPAIKTNNGSAISFWLDESLKNGLKSYCGKHQVSLFMILVAVVKTLLYKYTNQEDIVIGTPIAGRQHTDLENQIGLYVNTLALRTVFSEDESFESLLSKIKQTTLEAYEHQIYPFDMLVEDILDTRDLSRSSLFDVMIAMLNTDIEETDPLEWLDITPYPGIIVSSKFDLTFNFTEYDTSIRCNLEYNTDLFTPVTIKNIQTHFTVLIKNILSNTKTPLCKLQYISQYEQSLFHEKLNITPVEQTSTLQSLFETQVGQTPDNTALILNGHQMSYKELNEKANQLAHYIIKKHKVKPNDLVCLIVERSEWLLIGLLGIIKAGAAYVPIDPDFPELRIKFLLDDCESKLILTDNKSGKKFNSIKEFDITNAKIYRTDKENPKGRSSCKNLVYTMYTSGSTGRPKGVMVTHKNVVNFLRSMLIQPGIEPTDKLLALTTYSFDISVLEFFLPLIKGAAVILLSKKQLFDKQAIEYISQNQRPTIIQGTPSTFTILIENGWDSFENIKILSGGERMSVDLGEKLLKNSASLWNMYGPTETTIWSVIKHIENEHDFNCIGKPIANTQVYVLDKYRNAVGFGVWGELYIGGEGLAEGYYNRPKLTNEKFVNNPFVSGTKMYATGDIVKRRPDGDLEFSGRIDNQIKLRGHRIEIGEIEKVISNCPSIKLVKVVVREVGNEPQLVAYYSTKNDISANELRVETAKFLPGYMLPSHFMELDSFPLTPNQKIDLNAFPSPTQVQNNGTIVKGQVNQFEHILLRLWEEILVKSPGVDDNFFELGGHSLKATRLVARINEELGVQLNLIAVFTTPTIRDLAKVIETKSRKVPKAISIVEEQSHYCLSYGQQRFWLLWQLNQDGVASNLPLAFKLKGDLSKKALKYAFETVVQRHDILRTIFSYKTGTPKQIVKAPNEIAPKFVFIDLRNDPEPTLKAREIAKKEANAPFDLENELSMRVQLIKLDDHDHLFLLTMHHIISDEWSMEVLYKEMFVLYNAFIEGTPSDILPPLNFQYKDYSSWQQNQIGSKNFKAARQYFKQKFATSLPILNLIDDYPSITKKGTEANRITFVLSPGLSKEINTLSLNNGATAYMTLLGIFNMLLYTCTQQKDIIVGSPVACRNRPELENQIGIYTNTLVLRTAFDDNCSFTQLLELVRNDVIKVLEYQHYPFELIQDSLISEGLLKQRNLFDVGFTWQNIDGIIDDDKHSLEGVSIATYDQLNKHVKSKLWLHGWEINDCMKFSLSYNINTLSKSTANQLVDDFQHLCMTICQNPQIKISELKFSNKTESKMSISSDKTKKKNLERFIGIGKKPVRLKNQALVKESVLNTEQNYPVIFQPSNENMIVTTWASENKPMILDKLMKHGALLLRDFKISTLESFWELFNVIVDTPINYVDQSSPRSLIAEKIYTSTDYPADQVINMHSELSYSHKWPLHIAFFCEQPPQSGGETPIADSRLVLNNLSEEIKEAFYTKGILYTRNLVEGLGLSWQEVYQTDNKDDVEKYCTKNDIQYEWKSEKHLEIKWIRPAIIKHPKTSEMAWFNHGFFFNAANLDPIIQEIIGYGGVLPFNTYYGDGTKIDVNTIEQIRVAYEKAKVVFTWQKGDVLLLDNLLMSHGRNPYSGDRKILVGMGN